MKDSERRSVQSEESEDVPWKQLQQLDWWIVGAPPRTSMDPKNVSKRNLLFQGVYLTSSVVLKFLQKWVWNCKSSKCPEVLKFLKLGLLFCFQLLSLFAFLVFTHFLGFICEDSDLSRMSYWREQRFFFAFWFDHRSKVMTSRLFEAPVSSSRVRFCFRRFSRSL